MNTQRVGMNTLIIESGLMHYYINPGQITLVNRSVTAQPLPDEPKKKGLMSGRSAVTKHSKSRALKERTGNTSLKKD